ncbi:MAG TPA: hypothetical protein PLO24_07620, partial [Bacteroidales bacterium]|nr:hypothetical protein [Bacteroidales bacterium]
MRKTISGFCMMLLSLVISEKGIAQDNNWTHFRGSGLNGIASVETVPLNWNDDSGFRWKTDIHGRGWSSPVVYGDQIW